MKITGWVPGEGPGSTDDIITVQSARVLQGRSTHTHERLEQQWLKDIVMKPEQNKHEHTDTNSRNHTEPHTHAHTHTHTQGHRQSHTQPAWGTRRN
ncbi:unnamed protein product [Arctogadus glacialis]